MTITTSGGLVRLSGDTDLAANEDLVVEAPVATREAEEAAGWDPYEVWRTRVKRSRDASSQPSGKLPG